MSNTINVPRKNTCGSGERLDALQCVRLRGWGVGTILRSGEWKGFRVLRGTEKRGVVLVAAVGSRSRTVVRSLPLDVERTGEQT